MDSALTTPNPLADVASVVKPSALGLGGDDLGVNSDRAQRTAFTFADFTAPLPDTLQGPAEDGASEFTDPLSDPEHVMAARKRPTQKRAHRRVKIRPVDYQRRSGAPRAKPSAATTRSPSKKKAKTKQATVPTETASARLVSNNFVGLKIRGRKGKAQARIDQNLRRHRQWSSAAEARDKRNQASTMGDSWSESQVLFSEDEDLVQSLEGADGAAAQTTPDSAKKESPLHTYIVDPSLFQSIPDLENDCAQVATKYYQPTDQLPATLWVNIRQILAAVWGYRCFREGQLEVIRRILGGQSTLLVQATGSGKSLCYQLPALVLSWLRPRSVTLVISPIVSLMHDQVNQLPKALPGYCWSAQPTHNSSTTETVRRESLPALMRRLASDDAKVLFVSPERLRSQAFTKAVEHQLLPPVSLVCLDEAHCQSMWSHSFRPAYLHVHTILSRSFAAPCLLAMTGTLTLTSEQALQSMLHLNSATDVIRRDTLRKNLLLSVSIPTQKNAALVQLLKAAPFSQLNAIIVYVGQQREADQIAAHLKAVGFGAQSYHAGKPVRDRAAVQAAFMANRVRILVATIAFGLGINKSDIQAVIHYSLPRSLEDYAQEIGRCGRDGQTAYCHLLLAQDDYLRLRSWAYADRLEISHLRRWVYMLFRALDSKTTTYNWADPGTRDDLYDIPPTVLSTLLSYLEIHPLRPLGQVHALPQTVTVIFIKSDLDELANSGSPSGVLTLQSSTTPAHHLDRAIFTAIGKLGKVCGKPTKPITLDVLALFEAVQQNLGEVDSQVSTEDQAPVVAVDPHKVLHRLRYWKSRRELILRYGATATLVKLDPATLARFQSQPDAKNCQPLPDDQLVEALCDSLVHELHDRYQKLMKHKVAKLDMMYNLMRAAAEISVPKKVSATATRPESSTDEPHPPKASEADRPPLEFTRRKQTRYVRQWLDHYFTHENPGATTPGDKAISANWATLCDPAALAVQEAHRVALDREVRNLLYKYPQLTSGQAVAKVLHGLNTPCLQAATWRLTGLWGKYYFIDFDLLQQIAHGIIIDARCRSVSNEVESDPPP